MVSSLLPLLPGLLPFIPVLESHGHVYQPHTSEEDEHRVYDNQEYDKMDIENRFKMAESCGLDLRKLIHTYTGLDTHKFEDFL